jgi:hypothetical protein
MFGKARQEDLGGGKRKSGFFLDLGEKEDNFFLLLR